MTQKLDKRFTDEIIGFALASQAKWKVWASIQLGQWALESAFGTAMPKGSNNPFGIKAPLGSAHVSAMTDEVFHGKTVHISQPFAKFNSQGDAFDAHAKLLATSRFYSKFRAARDSEAAAHALVGIYATDPNYGSKLIDLMRANGLYQFDKGPSAAPLIS